MIGQSSAGSDVISNGVRPFREPLVPTGMNTGVGTEPWGRWTVVALARPDVA
eukprot:CAMPEP_0178526240 /NCGR_PEP_ID=MMETSP0696-20121128/30621_1 /TAXON_ID=265572 /ORGANISM="Extubocellulus spinifer, Strain CCMP396" /LENGTH=51 /DNA_ID=CAMNT_0020157729 /DNA_START=191 /DNA_END=346 /DNA_ORIENTATION=-